MTLEAPLSILIVEFLPSGGMFQFGFQFADALAAEGHDVEVMTGPAPELRSQRARLKLLEALPTWHPNAELGGTAARRKIRRVSRAFRLVESWRRVLLYTRRTRPDVVQFGELRYVVDSVGFWLVAHFGRAGIVVDVAHNPMPYDVHAKGASVEKSGRLTRQALGNAYSVADLVLILGEKPKQDLLRTFPSVRRAAVSGHGDYSSVVAGGPLTAPSGAGKTILFFGAWTKYKNIPLLLKSFALVRREIPEARLTIAGPPMPDVDVEEIRSLAQDVGHVDLKPEYVPMSGLANLFGGHRTVAFTYDTVNVSGSVHMAYTFGRPVVASNVGAMSDAVENGVTGLLSEHTVEGIAAALLTLLQDDARADRMGANAAERIQSTSSWRVAAGRAAAAYRETLADTPRRGGHPVSPL